MQNAPKQRHGGHDHMKDREDSTAGFKQVFLVYVDQKLKSGRGGEGDTYHLLRLTNGYLLDLGL